MRYTLSVESRQHISIHFGKSEKAGSYFYSEVFPNVDDLLVILENRDPYSIVLQSSNREAHTYDLSDVGACGTVGVGVKSAFFDSKIDVENRNGKEVEFIEVEELPSTSLLTIVCRRELSGFYLITIYPGEYAPAFPHDGMEPEELSWAMAFWDKHILLKKKL